MGIMEGSTPPYRIVSAFPGRVRVQFARALGPVTLGSLYADLRDGMACARRTRVAEDASSIIFEYDRRRRSLDSFLDCVEAEVSQALRRRVATARSCARGAAARAACKPVQA